MTTKPKILITGAFGYLGGRLSKYLHDKGFKLIICSRKKKLPPVWCLRAQVAKIEWEDSEKLINIFSEVDVVIHAAGMNAQDCRQSPDRAIDFNGNMTSNIVKISKSVGVKKFIYLSSSNVYKSPMEDYIDEDTATLNDDPYSTSKLAGEKNLLKEINARFKGNILRISNTIGPPNDKSSNCWSLLVNDLSKQVIKNNSIIIRGQKNSQRDFIPISSICPIVTKIIEEDFSFAKIINIGSGISLEVIEIAKMIQKIHHNNTGSTPSIKVIEQQSSNILKKLKYQSKYRKYFKSISLNEINIELESIYNFCQKNFRNLSKLND